MATIDRQATTPALAHALAAAARGLAVLPLSRTKLPALHSPHRDAPDAAPCHGECGRFGHGVHDASADPARVRRLFAAAPWATGYGIACGRPPHHLIGIDVDIVAGAGASAGLREEALRHLFAIPPTMVVRTPSGGRHLWLTGPPGVAVPNSAGRLAPGVDVRGTGGYLVGPGSRTRRGTYTVAPGTAHLAPAACPSTLLHLLVPPPRPGPSADGGHGRGLVRFVRSAHAGQRNTRLFWAACRAYENGMGPALREPLTAAALHTGLTEREARATLASAARLTGRQP
ncbi:bifunctional DNA primase/polymerase [Streptomyces tagetis]|uniref:Bifunctional DNA primase/polymerase n=1 Tax=Streptomyces tagetis TaxID=2820809 RepID=A0A941B0X9_9ACTN|nr:bifunctional DNA primase/polymerase [Streptomyces sp. RG38]MBQ0827830.1 bifunctional DNA primase/polymerase [Streptomyces sp. RG38]